MYATITVKVCKCNADENKSSLDSFVFVLRQNINRVVCKCCHMSLVQQYLLILSTNNTVKAL